MALFLYLRSTIPTTASRSTESLKRFRGTRSPAFMPWISCGGSARCTVLRNNNRRRRDEDSADECRIIAGRADERPSHHRGSDRRHELRAVPYAWQLARDVHLLGSTKLGDEQKPRRRRPQDRR